MGKEVFIASSKDNLEFAKKEMKKTNTNSITLDKYTYYLNKDGTISKKPIILDKVSYSEEGKKIIKETINKKEVLKLANTSKSLLKNAELDYNKSLAFVAKKLGVKPKYDENFVNALKEKQTKLGIKEDGILGIISLSSLIFENNDTSKGTDTLIELSTNKKIKEFNEAIKNNTVTDEMLKKNEDFITTKTDKLLDYINNKKYDKIEKNYKNNYTFALMIVLMDKFDKNNKSNPKYKNHFNRVEKYKAKYNPIIEQINKNSIILPDSLKNQLKQNNNSVNNSLTENKDIWGKMTDEKIPLGDKLNILTNSGLGAGAFVIFVGLFLFSDTIMEGGFFKKIGILFTGLLAYSLGKKDIIDGLNHIKPGEIYEGGKELGKNSAKVISESAKNAYNTISSATENAFDNIKKEYKNFELNKNSFSSVMSLEKSAAKESIFYNNKSNIEGVYKFVLEDEKIKNLKISDINNLYKKQDSLDFKNGIKKIIIDGKSINLKIEDLQTFLIALTAKGKNDKKNIGDYLTESSIGDYYNETKNWIGKTWDTITDGQKLIGAGIITSLFGYSLIGGAIIGTGLSKNLYFKEFVQNILGNEEYKDFLNSISKEIGKLSNKELKTEVENIFTNINPDTYQYTQLENLINKTKNPNDKKILELLKKKLVEIIVFTINTNLNRISDWFDKITDNKTKIKQKIIYLERLKKLVNNKNIGLNPNEKNKLLKTINIKENKLRQSLKKLGVTSTTFSTSEEISFNEEILENYENNIEFFSTKINQLLGEIEVNGNKKLKNQIIEIIKNNNGENRLKELSKINSSSLALQEIRNLLTIKKEINDYINKIDKIQIVEVISLRGIDTLSKKIYKINQDFENKKNSFDMKLIAGYNFSDYYEKYNQKRKSLKETAYNNNITQIQWGDKYYTLDNFQNLITKDNEKINLPKEFKKLINDFNKNSNNLSYLLYIYTQIDKFKKLNNYENQKSNMENTLKEKLNKVLSELERLQKSEYISEIEKNNFNKFKNIFKKYKIKIQALGYEISNLDKVIKEIDIKIKQQSIINTNNIETNKKSNFEKAIEIINESKIDKIKNIILRNIKEKEITNINGIKNKLTQIINTLSNLKNNRSTDIISKAKTILNQLNNLN